MTTIAWDGKTLAADRRAVRSNLPYTVIKLRRTKDGRFLAGAGDIGVTIAMLDWLSEPSETRAVRPACQDHESDWADILEVFPDARCFVHERRGAFEVLDPFFAIGSGRDFAIAAMALGQNAVGAVELASRFDIGTGNGIDSLTLGES